MYTENTENRDFMYECTKQVKIDLKDLKYDQIFVHFGRNRSFFEQTGQKHQIVVSQTGNNNISRSPH